MDFFFAGTKIKEEDLTTNALYDKKDPTFRHVLAAINQRMVPVVDSDTFLTTDFRQKIGVFTERKVR